ncbi:hypothetical protein [Kitasatospora sp. NPDC001132]
MILCDKCREPADWSLFRTTSSSMRPVGNACAPHLAEVAEDAVPILADSERLSLLRVIR